MSRRPLLRSLVALVALSLALAACGGDDSPTNAAANGSAGSEAPSVRLVATTTQLADFARQVGGSHVEVYGVLKANVDPHDFEPSPADLKALADADVIVKNGVDLEGWFDGAIDNAGSKATVVDASQGIELRHGADHDEAGHDEAGHDEAGHDEAGHDGHDHGDDDPHIWQSPDNARSMVRTVADALVAADPAHESDYRHNEATYAAELAELDAEIAVQVASLTNRKVVTNHDAFGYFLDHYGLEFVGSIIPSFDTQAELSPQDINEIVARIRATGVRAVFSESSLPPATAETIGREAGVEVVAGDDALYGDSLGPAGSDGDTYVKALRHNAEVLVGNLR